MRDHAGRSLTGPGSALEQRIAALLRGHGYEAVTNEVIEGRSGARHEIDVLGRKSDGLTTFSLAVECKAWDRPIEKDVVAKFAFVLGDIGVREGIVVCLGGWRAGAEIAARETGVALWGPDELSRHLGDVAVAELATRHHRSAPGLASAITDQRASALIERTLSGHFGRAEKVVWSSTTWLPIAVVQVALSRWEGRRRAALRIRRMWNAYELVDATLLASWSDPPVPDQLELTGPVITARHRESAPARAISQAVTKHGAVTTAAALGRAARRLDALGIPIGYDVVTEVSSTMVVPIHVAVVASRGAERVVAVDMSRGWVDPELSAMLSRNAHWLRSTLCVEGAG